MKVLIIGADSAISSAILECLTLMQAQFVATSRRKDSKHYFLDVSLPQADITSVIRQICDDHPDITHLLYTPATSADGLTHRISIEKWHEVFNVNLFGAIAVVNAMLPFFMKRAGHIQLISSSSSERPEAYSAAYSASKCALTSYAKSVAIEYARYGISCYTFSPGFFNDGLMSNVDEKRIKSIEQRIPNGKIATKHEIANFSVQLLNAAHYINGSNIVFNGGM